MEEVNGYISSPMTDRDGNEHKVIYSDFVARVFQHEYDHLIGKVFIDRVESTYDIVMEKEYQRIIKKISNDLFH